MFGFLDYDGDIRITRGHLPHWFQPGVTYFVTFRADDSVPAELATAWYDQRNTWLRKHAINPSMRGWQSRLGELCEALQREYHRTFTREYLEYLDRGYGECVLRKPELSKIVADALLHFDGQRYHLGDFVVMPNHVHLLVCLLGETDIEDQCYSWKKYAATRINKALGMKGRFWQEESFDHLVRSVEQFERFQWYIRRNPLKASLREGEYVLHALA